MCIGVFLWQAHALYPFILLLNRDEFHTRPTRPMGWWDDDGNERRILGGRDEEGGGTWLACNVTGKIAFITNVREVYSNPQSKSRGHLPLRFLQSDKNPREFVEEVAKEADQYNGFNLIVADMYSKSMFYISNRLNHVKNLVVFEVAAGIYVLSNASLDSPWPKAVRLRDGFKEVLDKYGTMEAEIPVKDMVESLMMNKVKDEDESLLPRIKPVEFEYQLSSIFIDTDSQWGRYGTRSTSALSVKANGEVSFHERYLDDEGKWKEHTEAYQVEKMKDINGR